MNKPYMLCGAALIFWGAVSGNLIIGIIAGVILEFSYFIKKKIDFTTDVYTRISDLTSIIFVASIVIIYFNNEPFEVLTIFAKWLPMVFYILILTQLYSLKNHVIIGTRIGKTHYTHQPMNVLFPYVLLTLFSTTTLNNRNDYYFFALFGIFALAFFYLRNSRYSWYVYIVVIAVLFSGSYSGQKSMAAWYENIRNNMRINYNNSFVEKLIRERMGQIPFEGVTSIGDVGELKLSGRIILRAEVLPDKEGKINNIYYLKDGTYDVFSPPNWNKKDRDFISTDLDSSDNWVLNQNVVSGSGFVVKVSQNLNGKKGLIPLPMGSYKIERLGGLVENDKYGTVRISEAARSINYKIWVNQHQFYEKKPLKADTMVLDLERKVVSEVGENLGIKNMEPQEALKTVADYFRENFKYTLRLERRRYKSYLEGFLKERKAGHCEYFATATVMLLREAGIPARYITGYVLTERSPYNEKMFLVRERHGHAWAEAYLDGKWITVDNTPSVWLNEDEKNAKSYEKITDYIDFIMYEIKNFFDNRTAKTNRIITGVIVALLSILGVRIYLQQRKNSQRKNFKTKDKAKIFKSIESDFLIIQKEIGKLGIPRMKHETIQKWVGRINQMLKNQKYREKYRLLEKELNELINVYYKLRFDPESLGVDELREFNERIRDWLYKWRM